jgi:hypothetical protein
MSYSIDTFKNLCSSYKSWSTLETFLTSPEGGNIRVVGSGRHRILRYVKGQTDMKVPHVKWFRSVVWDTETNRPVCVAPPKAETTEVPTGGDTKFQIQDFLDGTMMNTFIVKGDNTLHVSTRTQIGAGGTFYSTKTFSELFDEALKAMTYSSRADLYSVLPKPSSENGATFVSFLLQHPEHRVVSRPRAPRLFMIQMGCVKEDGTVEITEDISQEMFGQFKIPNYPINGYCKQADLDSFFKGLVESKGWFFQGLTLKDGKGSRWRIRNPNYLYLRSLRGSEATDMDRFLRLRSENKVVEYLKHYGEDRQTYWDLEQQLRAATKVAFDAYCEVHKAHSKKLGDLPKSVQPCVFRLHAHYLSDLKPKNDSIKMKDAVDVVNKMPVFEQRRLFPTIVANEAVPAC